ncbi:hypothetical protein PT283_08275 [Acetobacteraceae bacterium ESL0697]|nr:hypothetical protein [Acetobacteraceae bacterium ESL0697]
MSVDTRIAKPTKERVAKSDYETIGRKRVKLNAVKLLHEKGDIDGDAFTAAQWWLNDYIYAYYGYADFLTEPLAPQKTKGDLVTFYLSQAQAGLRIQRIRETLGLCVHERLKIFLVDEVSFTELGKKFYPEKDESTARKSAQAQIALILTQLSEFYLEEHKRRKREKLLAKTDRIVYTK